MPYHGDFSKAGHLQISKVPHGTPCCWHVTMILGRSTPLSLRASVPAMARPNSALTCLSFAGSMYFVAHSDVRVQSRRHAIKVVNTLSTSRSLKEKSLGSFVLSATTTIRRR